MPFELFVAWRYLRAKRKGLFAAVTTAIGIAGVTVGVAALITTLSVMNGFQDDIEKKVIGAQAHLTIYGGRAPESLEAARKAVLSDPSVQAVAPFALGQAIVSVGRVSIGVVLKGLNPAQEFRVNDLAAAIRDGRWEDMKGGAAPGIVLGEELARNLGAWVGEDVVLVSPQSVATPLGLVPQMRKFRVCGVLHTGYYEYDSTMAYADLREVSRFLGLKAGASGLEVRLHDINQAPVVASRLQRALGLTWTVRTYQDMNRTLFAALRLEKGVMFLILTLIILVASLNIASTLILRGVEKTRDIGLLKAMGATPRQIKRVFLAEGFLIGALGMGLGLGLGLFLCWFIVRYPVVELPADIYYLSRVPVHMELKDITAVMGVGFILSVLATVYPSVRAAKADPVSAIHYG